MKRKVRIYKAQMGGVQAIQNTAAQAQPSDEDLMNSAVSMIQQGATAEETLQALIDAGVQQEKATQIVSGLISYIGDQRDQEVASYEDDQTALEDLDADQQAQEQAAAEEEAYKQRMQQMYETDMSADDAEADAEEDQFMQENILARGGQKLPSKRNFVHRTVQTLRAQEGLDTGKNIADSTDTGARSEALSKFVGGLQSTADQALMKKDAEAMYEQMNSQPMMPQFDDTAYAQFGMNMRPGQQRRFNRRLNRAIGQVPIPNMPGLPFASPYNIITAPMLGGFPNQGVMPAAGSYYGGPRLANIDVRKTGLFGRPKEYTVTFAQEAYTNPTLRKQVIKQELRNKQLLTEDEIDELVKEGEDATGTTSETPKAQEEQVKSGKKDISSASQSGSSSNRARQAPVVAATEEITPAAEYVNPMDAIAQRSAVTNWEDIRNQVIPDQVVPAQNVYNNPMDAAMQNYASAKQTMNTGEFAAGPGVVEAKSKYSNQNTPQDSVYYNPDKPNFLYTYRDGNLYYDDASDAKQDWHAIKDPSRIAELNSKLRGANIYTLPSKAGFYYRQRPDGSYAKFQGDPAKHSASSKQVQIITPSDKNYKYLDQNKEYSFTFTGKKQMGGFTDMSSGLNKFVYGGNEDFTIPETGGKLTDSPYFAYGGSLPKAQDGKEQKKIVKAYKDGKFIGYTTQDIADSKGLDWNSADNYYDSEIDDTETKTGYNSYSPNVFPGGYAKQLGLPYDPVTGETYAGFIGPDTKLNAIDVRRSNMLTGAPKKYTMYFGNYDPTKPLIGQNPTTAGTDKKGTARTKEPNMPFQSRSRALSWLGSKLNPRTFSETEIVKGMDVTPSEQPKIETAQTITTQPSPPVVTPATNTTTVNQNNPMDWNETWDKNSMTETDRAKKAWKSQGIKYGADNSYTYFPDGTKAKYNYDLGKYEIDSESNSNIDARKAWREQGIKYNDNGEHAFSDGTPARWDSQQKKWIPKQAYGGNMGYAQVGQNYPYRNDPRFGTVYTDNPEYVGLTDINLISPEVTGIPLVGANNVTGPWYDNEPGINTPSRTEAQMAADPSLQIDPTQGNRQTTIKNLPGEFAVDARTKATNADLLSGLNKFNTGVNAALSLYGGRGERERLRKMYENYASDSVYGNSDYLDRGTYEANSGLYKPDEMGFKGVVKNGGYMQDGGDFSPYETYMSEDQVRRFLEEGGELEFV